VCRIERPVGVEAGKGGKGKKKGGQKGGKDSEGGKKGGKGRRKN
jgi:hypothetical protein